MNLSDEEILKEYFGVDEKNNNFKAETKLYFDMQNKYNNSETSKEWWAGLDLLNKPTITHNRKFIVLRAHMELTETAKWTNNPYVVAHEEYWYNKEAKITRINIIHSMKIGLIRNIPIVDGDMCGIYYIAWKIITIMMVNIRVTKT